ncbi:hypothetical protein [Psychromicrobium lacuslunae]|uniref:Uncharacterized protein n=1 Tax=Psychromicrobium lacuslunae TaxID=1618207 RepID=A0A0D4C105_9MICC|nr:hypothetical protein [Psychromicrobium lacuslunae]AJT42075.1 hypothetical protein UM93_12190 [Psychromicrobium lacuslunae]
MDNIEKMLRRANPIQETDRVLSRPSVQKDLNAAEILSVEEPTTPIRRPKRHITTLVAAACILLLCALGIGIVTGLPKHETQPALPSPTISVQTTPSMTPATSDPTTGLSCSITNIKRFDEPTDPWQANMRTYPGDFKVLGCAGGWMAFEFTTAAYKRLEKQGAYAGTAGALFLAHYENGTYSFQVRYTLMGWDTQPSHTTAAKIADMEAQLANIGIPAFLREPLVGNPPQN